MATSCNGVDWVQNRLWIWMPWVRIPSLAPVFHLSYDGSARQAYALRSLGAMKAALLVGFGIGLAAAGGWAGEMPTATTALDTGGVGAQTPLAQVPGATR